MFRNSSTYVYLALVIGLGCFLFIDKKSPGTREQEEAESRLFPFQSEDVTGLEINNVHGGFIFKKNNNSWEIKAPITALADTPTISGIIDQIVNAEPQRIIKMDGTPKDQDNLKEWGLSPAVDRAVIHTKDNKTYELLIGRKMAINDNVYARGSGRKNESVRVISNSVKAALEKDLSEFRSRHVFDFENDKVNKIAARTASMGATPPQECEVDLKDGKWKLEKPVVARASETSVTSELLPKLLALRAIDFVTDDASNLSQYGLTTPSSTLTVGITSGEDMVLQIGGPVPNKPDQVYAQRLKSNSVFTIAKASVDDFSKNILDVRDRHILPFDAGKANGVTFSFGNKKGEVHSEKGLWSTVGEGAGPADVAKVTDLLSKLSQLETTPMLKDSVTDLKPFGLDKPQGKITIETPNQKPGTLTLLIGKAENKLLFVRNSIEPFVYTVPENAFDFLPADNLDLRSLQVINIPLREVISMTYTSGSFPPVELTRSSGGTWTAENVKDRMVDSIKAETQASLFTQLQTKGWLGPVQPSYGLSKPVLTVSVKANTPTPVVLHIGAKLPDGTYAAQVEGNPTAFKISEGDFELLNISTLQPIPSVVSKPQSVATPPMTATNAPPAPASTNTAPGKK